MGQIVGLYEYPLTGARGVPSDELEIARGGSLMSRLFVLGTPSPDGVTAERYSAKQDRTLAQYEAIYNPAHTRLQMQHMGETWTAPVNKLATATTWLNEFGEFTPVIDVGDAAAEPFQRHLGNRAVRLYQKTLAWQFGEGRDPAQSKLAPLHVITLQSMEHIKQFIPKDKHDEVTAEHVRADIVVDAPEVDALIEYRSMAMIMNGIDYLKARDTERCPVPGNNPQTGAKTGAIPRAYPHLPKSPRGKAVLGAYLYADVGAWETVSLPLHGLCTFEELATVFETS